MKIQYFEDTDTLAIELTNKPVAATDAVSDDLILDYDSEGKVVAITLDNYSKNVDTVDLQAFGIALLAAWGWDLVEQALEGRVVKVVYDAEVDVLRILFSDAAIEESDEDKPGTILDYDAEGNIVGIEILDASKRMPNPRSIEHGVMS